MSDTLKELVAQIRSSRPHDVFSFQMSIDEAVIAINKIIKERVIEARQALVEALPDIDTAEPDSLIVLGEARYKSRVEAMLEGK